MRKEPSYAKYKLKGNEIKLNMHSTVFIVFFFNKCRFYLILKKMFNIIHKSSFSFNKIQANNFFFYKNRIIKYNNSDMIIKFDQLLFF